MILLGAIKAYPFLRALWFSFHNVIGFRVGDFVLSSGARSRYYVDARTTTTHVTTTGTRTAGGWRSCSRSTS